MKNKIEVGERVAGDWVPNDSLQWERVKGTFSGTNYRGLAMVTTANGDLRLCAPNSIRRLIKKPRREWEIRGEHQGFFNGIGAYGPKLAVGESITVREVKKK